MKVRIGRDEVWPDLVPADSPWGEEHEIPELVWKEYLYARAEYFTMKEKVERLMDQQKAKR